MNVIIRTDGSFLMGSGHVMRCLTLAEALRENDVSVKFVSRKHPGNINQLINKRGFKVVELNESDAFNNKTNSLKNDKEYLERLGASRRKDVEETIIAIGNNKPDWLIVDHYALCKKWECEMRPHVKNIMVIDDLANRLHDCDLLLDQNWVENMEIRYDNLVSAGCTKLLGPEYALLRPEFSKARKRIKTHTGDIKRIFVFFGGVDSKNITAVALRALSSPELVHLVVDVIIGENNPNQDEIEELAALRDSTHLYIQVDNMASIIAKADLAIGAGGVNTWERMCLGLPTITISTADNHVILLNDLMKYGYVDHLGHFSNVNETLIKKKLLHKISDRTSISSESKNVLNLVNGNGSKSVVDWLNGNFNNKNWKVKSATAQNMELYWDWANDEEVRINAINKKPIPWEDHVGWFNNKLDDKECTFYLIFIDNHPIGQVRFEDEGNYSRIDYSIARQFRGRKLAKKLLYKAIEEYQKHRKKTLFGEVLPGNYSSAKTFESLGFKMKIKKGNKIFTKNLGIVKKESA